MVHHQTIASVGQGKYTYGRNFVIMVLVLAHTTQALYTLLDKPALLYGDASSYAIEGGLSAIHLVRSMGLFPRTCFGWWQG
jgi:hypothetical protein